MKVPTPQKLPSGMYRIQLRLDGQSVSITEMSAKECTRKATLTKAEHLAGKRTSIFNENTLGAVLDAYIRTVGPVLSPSTIRGYKQIRANRFKAYMGMPVKSIKWQQMINAESKLVSAKTLKNAWGLVRSALAEADITLPKIRLPSVPVKEIPFLQPEEIFPFIEAVRGDLAEIPILLELHGLRRSEAKGLDWQDVDLVNGTLHIHAARVQNDRGAFVTKSTTKNRSSSRTIPIVIPRLTELLSAVENKTGRVVTVSENAMLTHAKAACEKAGITVVGNHGLRHSFASLGYHLGLNERQLMELGGWADHTTMNRIYIRLANSARKSADDALLSFFAK